MDTPLDIIGIIAGTDKSSLKHGYLEQYDALLREYKNRAMNVIEIGVFNGSSLRTWKAYFSQAKIIGIDMNDRCRIHGEDRVEIEIGSQADGEFLKRVCEKYPPTIIIDDGSHVAEHVLFSFRTLFPLLSEGGLYIVEDMHFHLGSRAEEYRGITDITPPDFFRRAYEHLLAGWIANEEPEFNKYLFNHIERITALTKALAIRKATKTAPDDQLGNLETAAEQINSSEAWARVAELMLKKRVPATRAEHAAKRAIEINGANAHSHYLLSVALRRQKAPLDKIVAQAARAAELDSLNPRYIAQLGTCYFESGNLAMAEDCFRKAISLNSRQPSFHESLAEILWAAGNKTEAVKKMQEAEKLTCGGPRHPSVKAKLDKFTDSMRGEEKISAHMPA